VPRRASAPEVPPGWPPGFADRRGGREDLLRLSVLRGITPRRLRSLAWHLGSPHACVGAVRAGRAGNASDLARIETVTMERVDACGASFVAFGDPRYPIELADLTDDPPGWLFLRGRPLTTISMRVAIVGARRCSPLGRDIAFDLGRRLAGAGVEVVSGAAAGVDAASHRGALAAPGPTVAVLGSGIDVAYPATSRDLIERIAHTGTVVSEYPPGVSAAPHHFPARNRIVAALASALVVVEGRAKSGSRISVDHALDLGRDVFAVAGSVASPLSETPLELIRDGATMIRGADDLLDDLGVGERLVASSPDLPEPQRRAYEALADPSLVDAVARGAGLSVPDVVAALTELELRGLVRLTGGRYERTLVRP